MATVDPLLTDQLTDTRPGAAPCSKQAHNTTARCRTAAGQQTDAHLTAGIVDRDARGMTIRGAKMLGAAAVMANEVLVTCIQPLQPGDERYAVSFAIPINSPGLTVPPI